MLVKVKVTPNTDDARDWAQLALGWTFECAVSETEWTAEAPDGLCAGIGYTITAPDDELHGGPVTVIIVED